MALARLRDLSLDGRSRALALYPHRPVPVAGRCRAFLHLGRNSGARQQQTEAPTHVGQDRWVFGAVAHRLANQSTADRCTACPGIGAARAAMHTVMEKSRPGDVVYLTSLRVPRLISRGVDRRRNSRVSFAEDRSIYKRTSKELQSIEQARRDAPDWFVPFQQAGLHVIFEAPKPVFRAHPFYCVDVYNRNNPDCRGGLTELRADQEAYRAPILGTLADLAGRYPGTALWDPFQD